MQVLLVTFTDNLFDLWKRGGDQEVPEPLPDFCNDLHRVHFWSSNYGIASMQHRKGLYTKFLQEFIILDVVPLIPGTNNPQINPSHRYIKVRRSLRRGSSFLDIWRLPQDEVIVVQEEDEAFVFGRENYTSRGNTGRYPPSELLATLSWEDSDNIPTLLDMFSLITVLSLSLPFYDRFTCQCNWLARTIYTVARDGFHPPVVLEAPGNKLWRIIRFLLSLPSRLLAPNPPEGLSGFCGCMRLWNDFASREQQ